MPLDKATLERLIDASPDMVVATDAAGNIAYYNDGAQRNLGFSREEIIGHFVTELYPSPQEAKRVMAAMRDPGNGGKGVAVNLPTVFVAKNNQRIPVAISGVILLNDQDEEQGTIGFAKDLTEMQRKDQLAVLGEVAIGLSHEINNPLTVITNQISLLESYLRDAGGIEQLERLASIRQEIGRIEGHIGRLREMSEQEEYTSTGYLGGARMVDLSRVDKPLGPLHGYHLMVVDDDTAVRESVVEILINAGASVDSATNGREALQRLENSVYDLVLSDVVMPEMDGYELLMAARKLCPNTQVVLMTAFYFDKDHIIKRSRMEGLERVLFKKPIKPDRLIQTLSELLTPVEPDPS